MNREEREEMNRREDAESAQAWRNATLGIPFEAFIFYLVMLVGCFAFIKEVFGCSM